ncbi:MAG TPA: Flp pilus assembly protein CpaB [Candidatus Nanopelagicales bacterium]
MPLSIASGRLVRRHRRALAGLFAALAILTLGLALRPPPPATRTVVVAARALATGTRLEAGHLTTAAVPTGVALPGVADRPDPLVGRVLAAPLIAGEPVALTRLASPPGSGWALPPGSVPLPVRFPDAGAVALLGAGQQVDVLVAAGPSQDAASSLPLPARVVARGALVLAVTGAGDQGEATGLDSQLGPAQGLDRAPLVVLAVTESQALAIAGAASSGTLGFTLASPPAGSAGAARAVS